jgi:hypothetical protein
MGEMTAQAAGVAWGVAGRPLPGEAVSGDLHVVETFPTGALAAVIDGLGHGPEAAQASAAAAAALKANPRAPVLSLVAACHAALRGTRGAVMSLASFSHLTRTVSWVGVGNVEGMLLSGDGAAARESIVSRAGVVGYQLPPLREAAHGVRPGDVLILASDGIRSSFVEDGSVGGEPQAIADRILAAHGKTTDDALVLVVRYLGRPE